MVRSIVYPQLTDKIGGETSNQRHRQCDTTNVNQCLFGLKRVVNKNKLCERLKGRKLTKIIPKESRNISKMATKRKTDAEIPEEESDILLIRPL